jgi:hypothetical protein
VTYTGTTCAHAVMYQDKNKGDKKPIKMMPENPKPKKKKPGKK